MAPLAKLYRALNVRFMRVVLVRVFTDVCAPRASRLPGHALTVRRRDGGHG